MKTMSLDEVILLCNARHAPNLGSTYWRIGRNILISKSKLNAVTRFCIILMFCRWVYTQSFTVDRNFTASHQRQKRLEDDVPLTNRQAFITESSDYKEHLKVAMEFQWDQCTCNKFKADQKINVTGYDATGIGSVACLQIFFFFS